MPWMGTWVALALSALLSGCGDSDAAAGGGGSAGCSGCAGAPEGGSAGAGGGAGSGASAGCAGCDGGAGAGGLAPGCFDMVVTPAVLGTPPDWQTYGDPIPGGLWASGSSVHFAWIAYRIDPEANGQSVPTLVISTPLTDDGTQAKHDLYELFPNGFYRTTAAISSFAGRADGRFAVGHERVENGEHPERVALGQLGEADFYQAMLVPTVGEPTLLASQTAAAWDGEAFALHAYGAPPQFTLHVARVDDLGNVVLPFTEYGITANPAPGVIAHRTSTSLVSGRTWVFDADGQKYMNGHERDGARLAVIDPPPMELIAPGTSMFMSSYGVVAADPKGGAWFVWTDAIASTIPPLAIAHVDAGGQVGAVFQALPPNGDEGRLVDHAAVARGSELWIASATAYRMYTFVATDAALSPGTILIDGLNDEADIRAMEAIEHDGDVWLSYAQYKGPSYLRVVKAAPGCVYPAKPSSIP
jgi:hypothetical protein